ncbi:MAG: two-component system response regulator [Candidatus Omnitrophota bacterium]|nr:MAG: two-component system response regulator [Candidatus Omnitrophota bacterium]
MNELIAVIDDEPDILELVSLHLTKSNFKVKGFLSAESFFKFLSSKIPDLIILDLMLPDSDGIEICKYLKSKEDFSSIPIIMLTARASETDKVLGLELGADDYVTKPFSPRELVARVKAVLRRKTQDSGKKIKIGDILLIDLNKFEVFAENKKIDLTPTEFRILKILASKKGWVFTRDQILNHLWGQDKAVLDRTIDVHIKNLKEKLGKAKRFIKNVRGIGYKIEE